MDDDHRMAEAGLAPAGAQLALIEGEIIDVAPMGMRHRSAVMRLSPLLHEAVKHTTQVSTQLPVQLDGTNEPAPDLALLKVRDDVCASALPIGPDCLLIIEVADTTLAYDVRIKIPLFALHGVSEVWMLDLAGGPLRRLSAPVAGAYSRASALRARRGGLARSARLQP